MDLEGAQKGCPKCGLALEALGWTEDAEVAEIEVRAHRRVIRRRKYKPACRCGVLPGIVTAPAPARLIPKGKLGISVWVEILLEKFDQCRPTHRLLQQWRDHGLTLSAGTVAGGLKQLQGLFLPVAEAIAQQQRTQDYWQADETGWPVFVAVEGKSGRLWHLWVFLSASTAVYQLQPSRSSEVPQSHLGSAQGTLLTDRYSAYKKLVRISRGVFGMPFAGLTCAATSGGWACPIPISRTGRRFGLTTLAGSLLPISCGWRFAISPWNGAGPIETCAWRSRKCESNARLNASFPAWHPPVARS